MYYSNKESHVTSIDALCSSVNKSHSALSQSDSLLWHCRLGHYLLDQMHHIPTFPPHISKDLNVICQVCPKAKQCRRMFHSASTTTVLPFEMLHVDTWGPYKENTYDGFQYFLTIMDDFTCITWTHLLVMKSNALSILQHFVQYVYTQFQACVKIIRTDNVLEFLSKDAKDFYTSQGIQHQTTCAYTPHQNGVVERKHKHILETARSLLFQSNLPISFWGDCILTPTYLINRFPLPSLNHKTPFQMLFNKVSQYEHLRSFGCLCYASTTKPGRSKFDMRAFPCVFIGYPFGKKAYKLFDLQKQSVVYLRDVKFFEKCFPYHNHVLPSAMPLPTVPYDYPIFIYYPQIIPSTIPPSNSDLLSLNLSNFESSSADILPSPCVSSTDTVAPSSPSSVPCVSHPTFELDILPRSSLTPAATDVIFSHHLFVGSVLSLSEPSTYSQAIQDPQWISAMNTEIQALVANGTWEYMTLPAGKKTISCKWVYRIKLKADGTIKRYKARLVAKGFTQKHDIDYHETFSPVVKMATVRCLLAVAASRGLSLSQLDVHNAFLHGDLHEEVYMRAPEGVDVPGGCVCRLRKSLYGLKQASRQWASKLSEFLVGIGIAEVKAKLHDEFSIKDLGTLNYFLGFEIGRSDAGVTMSQRKFATELIHDSGIRHIQSSKQHVTPLPLNLKLVPDDGELLDDAEYYRRMVGKLNFLTHTRPDLSFSVQAFSQFMKAPMTSHLHALHHILGYVHNTVGQGLLLKGSTDMKLQAFSESDWAACPTTHRSITGYLLTLGGAPISWKSKKQATISLLAGGC
ncbi:transmembrane signal receptor [Lithospermum erythrorhizon]|uniref:Transmembrane signal receptor n=1 Tax=Lithospermum erythrorhizon TaxID=34254 RepID=A0AAV3NHJ5_LITER